MASLVVQTISLAVGIGGAGLQRQVLVAASAGGDDFPNEGKTFLDVDNADAGGITVTITGQRLLPLGTPATKTIAVGVGERRLIGPFPVGNYNRETDESVEVDYSAVANVTVGAFSVNDDYN